MVYIVNTFNGLLLSRISLNRYLSTLLLLAGVKLPDSESNGITKEYGVVAGNPDNLNSFIKEFIKAIAEHRHWDRENIDKVPA